MKKRNIFWGLFFILAAVFVIVSQLGYFEGISFVKIFFTVVLAGVILSGIVHVEFGSILFPIAIICIMYDKQWGITELTPWPVLATALFGTIGLSMVFHRFTHRHHHHYDKQYDKDEDFDVIINDPDSCDVHCTAHMGSTIKYVNTEELKKADIDVSFGDAKVYFDKAKMAGDQAVIDLDVSFGGLEIYLPKEWAVVYKVDCFCGGIDEKGMASCTEDAKIILSGRVKFGGVTIYFI